MLRTHKSCCTMALSAPYNCCRGFCDGCATQLEVCPMCRHSIQAVSRLVSCHIFFSSFADVAAWLLDNRLHLFLLFQAPSHSRDSLVSAPSLPSPSPLAPLVETSREQPLDPEPSESSELLPDPPEEPTDLAQNSPHPKLWGWMEAFKHLSRQPFTVALLLRTIPTHTRHAVWNHNPVNDLIMIKSCNCALLKSHEKTKNIFQRSNKS